MLLAIDAGNTSVVFAISDGTRWLGNKRIETAPCHAAAEIGLVLRELLCAHGVRSVRRAVVGCVVPTLKRPLMDACHTYLGCRPLDAACAADVGIEIAYNRPSELGIDRIANAVAVRSRTNDDALVVDLGTATKVDFVSRDGVFAGGVIAPGVMTAFDGLLSRAASLRRFEIQSAVKTLGQSTRECLESGAIVGHAAMIDGLIERLARETHTRPEVFTTGGFAEIVAPHSKTICAIDPYLTLDGLKTIHERSALR